ncbi:hypothetical protein [Aneurinibacillus uraniidurans]|uniref:hypothetical protein n=1 Tax=Aneurinibacillus uraniidurans TaxID=2966586 RepID=UPI0023492DC8|nr:hypothetical protein [Aneurinibacillus sp. B1]WCN38809.1 hypothetical protein PO771_05255 [Aneurinibacillus sp. B1]
MAICIEFRLIEVNATIARYQYGQCMKELDGTFEVDIPKLISGEISKDTPMDEVVRLLPSKYMNQSMANRAFSKIYKYYLENKGYPSEGGYYA